MSAMRSASSSTTCAMSLERQRLAVEQVDHAARAWRRRSRRPPAARAPASRGARRRRRWRSARRRPRRAARARRATWMHSSRVGTSTMAFGRPGLGVADDLQQRQAEGERLARAGLGLAAHVAAGDGVGDGERLDGKGPVDAPLGERLTRRARRRRRGLRMLSAPLREGSTLPARRPRIPRSEVAGQPIRAAEHARDAAPRPSTGRPGDRLTTSRPSVSRRRDGGDGARLERRPGGAHR